MAFDANYASVDDVEVNHTSKSDAKLQSWLKAQTEITINGNGLKAFDIVTDQDSGKVADTYFPFSLSNKTAKALRKALNEALGDA